MESSEPVTLPAPVISPMTPALGKWEREHQAFRRLLLQLLQTHRGQYVAIHDGRVVATGTDKLAVAMQAFAQVGNVPIHVGLVSEGPEPVVRSGVRRAPSSSGGDA